MKIDTFIDIPLKNRNFQLKFILIFFFSMTFHLFLVFVMCLLFISLVSLMGCPGHPRKSPYRLRKRTDSQQGDQAPYLAKGQPLAQDRGSAAPKVLAPPQDIRAGYWEVTPVYTGTWCGLASVSYTRPVQTELYQNILSQFQARISETLKRYWSRGQIEG